MQTVLKIPVYLEIETGNVDRAKVTAAMQKIIIPELVRHLITFGNKITFSSEEKIFLQNSIGPFQCKLLSDVQALVKPKEFSEKVFKKDFDFNNLNNLSKH